ncbi:MAG: AraC family transcriptional regulator [Holophagales bacterium]|nr:AraC family transcriptional regulator [Holophagales bacterium]
MPVLYRPMVCLITGGQKQVVLGDRVLELAPAHYLVAGIDLPVVGSVVRATSDDPYLCVQLEIDVSPLSELVVERELPTAGSGGAALLACETSRSLGDAFVRLLRLLDEPEHISVLAPMIQREILYRLATGPAASMMRQIAVPDSRLARIARVIGWLKKNYELSVTVESLAQRAAMSLSSFYTHFKTIAGMTPTQYRTRLRLQRARHLMIAEGLAAAAAGFRVGYESPSQFSREYVRLFGDAPARDASRIRREGRGRARLEVGLRAPGSCRHPENRGPGRGSAGGRRISG